MAEILIKIVGMDGAIVAELEGDALGTATHLTVQNNTDRRVSVQARGVGVDSRDIPVRTGRIRTTVSPTLIASRGVDDDSGNAALSVSFTDSNVVVRAR